MNNRKFYTTLGAAFVATSALLYFVQFLIFRDARNLFFYLIHNLAFLPLEVFLVVIVIERILARREKQALLLKLNMVVGTFFSEVGNESIRRILPSLKNREELLHKLDVKSKWTHKEFRAALAFVDKTQYRPDINLVNLPELKSFLVSKRNFLLRLLENPNLLEHERVTDLLWATFHLMEELEARPNFNNLPEADLRHLELDIERMYRQLTGEWVSYVEHLKNKYPYLFSLLVRTHPFQNSPSAVVKN